MIYSGLDGTLAPQQLQDNQLAVAENTRPFKGQKGYIAPRKGQKFVNDTEYPSAIWGFFPVSINGVSDVYVGRGGTVGDELSSFDQRGKGGFFNTTGDFGASYLEALVNESDADNVDNVENSFTTAIPSLDRLYYFLEMNIISDFMQDKVDWNCVYGLKDAGGTKYTLGTVYNTFNGSLFQGSGSYSYGIFRIHEVPDFGVSEYTKIYMDLTVTDWKSVTSGEIAIRLDVNVRDG